MYLSGEDSPAVKALGQLFKITEVHLWDDGLSEVREPAYIREPIKFIDGDYKDWDKSKFGRSNGFRFSLTPDDVELARELNDLGLPLSFHTNKETRYGVSNGKKKGTRKKNQEIHTETDVFMATEEENRFCASLIDDTSKMFHQIEIVDNCTVEEIDRLSNSPYTSTLTNDHDYNRETSSSPESGSGNSEGSFLANEINEELNALLLMDHKTEGQLNGSSSNVIAYWDDFYKRTYFYNVETGESTWDPPLGMEHLVSGDNADEKTGKYDEVQVQAAWNSLSRDTGNEDVSLSKQLDGIMGKEISVDNGNITAKWKKEPWKTNIDKKLSVSSEDLQGVGQGVVPHSISKYWCQRYQLFSRFDYGIKMDIEGWFSVTPEALAKHHALRCGYGTIVDFFTGVGGNAIQFAQRSKHVTAIDIDPNKIDYARHNAAIYGVDNNIDFIKGDSFSLAPTLKANTVFMSPPWGGPDYSKVKKFDIKTMIKPKDGQSLFDAGKSIAPKIVMFLPRNVDVNQLAEISLSATPPWSLEVEMNYLNGRLKGVTAYFLETE